MVPEDPDLLQHTAAHVCCYASMVRHRDRALSDRLIERAADLLALLAEHLRAQRMSRGH